MKNLTLLTAGLLFTALAQASIRLETTLTEGDKTIVLAPVVMDEQNNVATYDLDRLVYEIVLTKYEILEDHIFVGFDMFVIEDGVKTLIAQPEIAIDKMAEGLATLTIGDEDSLISFTLSVIE